jgi:ribosomal protein L24
VSGTRILTRKGVDLPSTQKGQEAAIVKFCEDRDADRERRQLQRRLKLVFERSDFFQGSIYAEANELSDLVAAIKDLPGVPINPRIELVPPENRQQVFNLGLSVQSGTWIRVGWKGRYYNDLGHVLNANPESNVATILVIPRIPVKTSARRRSSRRLRPSSQIFNPRLSSSSSSSPSFEPLDHQRVKWNGEVFRGGLLEKEYSPRKLFTASPTIPELLIFREARAIDTSVITKALFECAAAALRPGNRVYLVSGEQAGLVGKVEAVADGAISVLPEHGSQNAITVPFHAVRLRLLVGDYVRVVAGVHAERRGWVTTVVSSDDVDTVTFADDLVEMDKCSEVLDTTRRLPHSAEPEEVSTFSVCRHR